MDDEIIFADIDPFTIKVSVELQYDKKAAAKFLSEHVFCNCLLMYECSQSETWPFSICFGYLELTSAPELTSAAIVTSRPFSKF